MVLIFFDNIAHTAEAHAPVPHAIVSPTPLSQTLISTSLSLFTFMNSTFVLFGKISLFSIRGPHLCRGIFSRSALSPIKITQWGFPMETQFIINSPYSVLSRYCPAKNPSMRNFSSIFTGILSGSKMAFPIFTFISPSLRPQSENSTNLRPARVSIFMAFPSASFLSSKNLAMHLIPLPHISATVPSEL